MAKILEYKTDPDRGLTRTIRKSLTFGIIVGNRGGNPNDLVKNGRQAILEVLQDLGHETVCLDEQDSPSGGVGSLQDARKCANLFKQHAEEIHGVLVTLPNFGDERAIANALRWANLNVPVLVQAEPDDPKKMLFGQRRDSFCGKISACNNLLQYGIPYTLTSNHTCGVRSEEFQEEIENFAAVCRVVNGIRGIRVGAIGTRPAAFNTVRYSEKILEFADISVEPLDLSEVIGRVQTFSDQARMEKRVSIIEKYAPAGKSLVPPGSMERLAKLSLVIEDWVKEMELDAIAFQCWTAVEKYLEVAPCTVLSLFSDNLIPAACEVDVLGAISMLALELASGHQAALLDWNNNFGGDPDKCMVFHCSNLPVALMSDATREHHFSPNMQPDKGYGALFGHVDAGSFTFTRLSTDDLAGEIMYYVGEGDFTDDKIDTYGGYGVVEIPGLQDLLQMICLSGFEHHFAVTRGNVAHIVEEAFSTYLDYELV